MSNGKKHSIHCLTLPNKVGVVMWADGGHLIGVTAVKVHLVNICWPFFGAKACQSPLSPLNKQIVSISKCGND